MDFKSFVVGRNPKDGEAAIYVLEGPDGPGYVGSTAGRLNTRLRNHWRWTIGDRMLGWIRSLDGPPTLRVLMYVPRAETLQWERTVLRAHVAEGYGLHNTRWMS